MSYYTESQCEVSTTPLRAFNANVGILYGALAVISIVLVWFSSSKTGGATFDSNLYRLFGHYSRNTVVPPASTLSLVNLTPHGIGLILLAALILGALFHAVYAVDSRRLYTLLLVDRCNGMRWSQFALIHTLLAVVVAQLLGSTTFDFLWFTLFAMPILGILGYFADKSYPCCPTTINVVMIGMAILILGYWVPVIMNFAYRYSDAQLAPPAYMWLALFALALFDIFIFVGPILQSRQKLSYFVVETMNTLALLSVSAVVLVAVGWAMTDQA